MAKRVKKEKPEIIPFTGNEVAGLHALSEKHASMISKAGQDSDINVDIKNPGEVKVEDPIICVSQQSIRSEFDKSVIPPENRYWIKNGLAVSHIDYPGIKMRVQQLRKVQKEINDGRGGKKLAEFIAGVSCTWLDQEHKFQQGLFHTKEIIPWKD